VIFFWDTSGAALSIDVSWINWGDWEIDCEISFFFVISGDAIQLASIKEAAFFHIDDLKKLAVFVPSQESSIIVFVRIYKYSVLCTWGAANKDDDVNTKFCATSKAINTEESIEWSQADRHTWIGQEWWIRFIKRY
jgi:hypothetical protein